jgi:FkbM family methyltransferase
MSDVKQFDVLGQQFTIKLHSCSELTSDIIRKFGTPDLDDIAAYCELLNPGDVYIDVGANIGWNVVFAAKLVGATGHVYAFEPDPDNYALLLENIELNQLTNVTAVKLAVSDRAYQTKMYKSWTNFGDHIVDPARIDHPEVHSTTVDVECVTLDDYLANQDLSQLKLIKIDVQGHDLRVIQGAGQILAQHDPAIIIEYCPYHLKLCGTSPFDVLSFIDLNDYEVYRMDYHYAQARGISAMIPVSFHDIMLQLTQRLLPYNTHVDLCLIKRPPQTKKEKYK